MERDFVWNIPPPILEPTSLRSVDESDLGNFFVTLRELRRAFQPVSNVFQFLSSHLTTAKTSYAGSHERRFFIKWPVFQALLSMRRACEDDISFQCDSQTVDLDEKYLTMSKEIKMYTAPRMQVGTFIWCYSLLIPDFSSLQSAKRGVNSWMAFRCECHKTYASRLYSADPTLAYYSKIFKALQQKNTSSLLKTMWDRDPFKAKWSIIARAYTSIRNQVGKTNASIDIFFDIVCPRMGIISVEDYLIWMRWTIETSRDGTILLHQDSLPDLRTFPPEFINGNLTEKDVVRLCAFHNYLTGNDAIAIAGQNTAPSASSFRQAPQQGLFASIPVSQAIDTSSSCIVAKERVEPIAEASSHDSSFNIEDFLTENWHNAAVESDYYNFDGELLSLNDIQSAPLSWDDFIVHSPDPLDSASEDIKDGRTSSGGNVYIEPTTYGRSS